MLGFNVIRLGDEHKSAEWEVEQHHDPGLVCVSYFVTPPDGLPRRFQRLLQVQVSRAQAEDLLAALATFLSKMPDK